MAAGEVEVTVDELVEQWRVQLGLRPWDEHAAMAQRAQEALDRANERPMRETGRRSGRTTRGILEALARCQIADLPKLYIGGATGRMGVYRMAAHLADRLELETWFRYLPAGRTPCDGLIYVDHAG